MRVAEHHFNTPEGVHNYLAVALAMVEELETPEDLRVAVFAKAAELLAAKQVFFDQPAAVSPLMAIPQNHGRR